MPKLYEVAEFLNKKIPFDLKEEWDNVGIILGDLNSEIHKVIVAMDCTKEVCEEAISKNANLIITHHPLIFDGIKNIDSTTSSGRKIMSLIKSDISLIALHTNFDKIVGGTSDTLAKILGLCNVVNIDNKEFSLGKVGDVKETSLKDFALFVKEKLNTDKVKYLGNENQIIKKVAVVSGSGSEFYLDAKNKAADLLVTSEVKHHIAIDAMENDIAIIDAGHFETENIAMNSLSNIVKEIVPHAEVSECYKELFKVV